MAPVLEARCAAGTGTGAARGGGATLGLAAGLRGVGTPEAGGGTDARAWLGPPGGPAGAATPAPGARGSGAPVLGAVRAAPGPGSGADDGRGATGRGARGGGGGVGGRGAGMGVPRSSKSTSTVESARVTLGASAFDGATGGVLFDESSLDIAAPFQLSPLPRE